MFPVQANFYSDWNYTLTTVHATTQVKRYACESLLCDWGDRYGVIMLNSLVMTAAFESSRLSVQVWSSHLRIKDQQLGYLKFYTKQEPNFKSTFSIFKVKLFMVTTPMAYYVIKRQKPTWWQWYSSRQLSNVSTLTLYIATKSESTVVIVGIYTVAKIPGSL